MSNRLSNRTKASGTSSITDKSIRMEKKMLIEALEQALIKDESPEMQMYRNKYM
jgi:hypothetical protein